MCLEAVNLLEETNTPIPDPNVILKLLLFTQEIKQLQKPHSSKSFRGQVKKIISALTGQVKVQFRKKTAQFRVECPVVNNLMVKDYLWEAEMGFCILYFYKQNKILILVELTGQNNEFYSSSKNSPDVIHTQIHLAAKTAA